MPIGEMSQIVPDRGLNILYRDTMNTLMNLTEEGLTRDNYGANTQSQNNTRLSADTPNGLLAGQMVKVGTTSGTVVMCEETANDIPVGVVINNAVGYAYESSSGVGSGKCPYLHGHGTVISTDLYETVENDGATGITYSAGDQLYCSQNGMFTNESNLGGPVVGVVLIAPTATDPFMGIQLRI